MTKKPAIGVLMLNTRFPRLLGDIGNPASFEYPVVYQTIEKATPSTIVSRDAVPESLQADFEQASRKLLSANVSLITTSCGFLSPLQLRLASQCPVPVITSALTLLPLLAELHGGFDRLGVLTFDRHSLSVRHLGANAPVAIEGLSTNDSLRNTIANDLPELDQPSARQEVMQSANRLTCQSPELGAIVLECTNLSPYKQQLREYTGLPVYDIVDAVHWLMESRKLS